MIFVGVILQLSFLSDVYARQESVVPYWLGYIAILCVLATVCGVFMLLGANWARILYIAGCFPLLLIFELTSDGPAALLRAVIPGLLCLLLLSQRANLFFIGRNQLFATPERDPYARSLRRERIEY